MARYKPIDTSPRFLAVDLHKQLLPGSLAYAVNHLLDHDFDLSGFDAHYCNDAAGACAYPPGMLLKVILCAYAEDKTRVRQVCFSRGKVDPAAESFTDKMKRAIDSEEGRQRYGQRFATVEPVFGNLRHNKRLNRFTLRGQQKVDTQWKLYCLVHNIEKLAHHGYGQ